MKLAYFAGPYTSKTGSLWEQKQNIREAEEISVKLWQMGFVVICPHANTSFFDGAIDYQVFLDGDLVIIDRVDLIVMSPRWESSNGARGEKIHAEKLGKPIFYWPQDEIILRDFAK